MSADTTAGQSMAGAGMAGAPILVIEHEIDDPVGTLGGWLRAAGAELDVRFGPSYLPTDLTGYAGLVVMGGAPNATDDVTAPWLPAVRALLASAVAAELPTLGVCLGGQLLAVATGGRVERAEQPEYGAQLVAKRQAAAQDYLFAEVPITPDVIQWHVDEITRLPPGALLLASSPTCDVQAFRVGRSAWGLQFHIETTPDVLAGWAASDEHALADYDVPALLAKASGIHDDLAEVWAPVADRFVALTRDRSLAGSAPQPARRNLLAGPTVAESVAGPISDPAEIRAALAAEMQAARGFAPPPTAQPGFRPEPRQ